MVHAPCLEPLGAHEEKGNRGGLFQVEEHERADAGERHRREHVERALQEEAVECTHHERRQPEQHARQRKVRVRPLPELGVLGARPDALADQEEHEAAHRKDRLLRAHFAALQARPWAALLHDRRAEERPVEWAEHLSGVHLARVVVNCDAAQHQVELEVDDALHGAELLLDQRHLRLAAHARDYELCHLDRGRLHVVLGALGLRSIKVWVLNECRFFLKQLLP